jgi:hypothetical protein
MVASLYDEAEKKLTLYLSIVSHCWAKKKYPLQTNFPVSGSVEVKMLCAVLLHVWGEGGRAGKSNPQSFRGGKSLCQQSSSF